MRLRYEDSEAENGYIVLQKNNVALRRKTNSSKKDSPDEKLNIIQKFHRNLRKAVQSKRRRNPDFDAKWEDGSPVTDGMLTKCHIPL